MQDIKMTDQVTRHENAGHEIATCFSIIVIINIVRYYPKNNTHETQNKIEIKHHKTTQHKRIWCNEEKTVSSKL